MGNENRVKHSSQLVTFIIELTEPCLESRWYKEGVHIKADGTDAAGAHKYRIYTEGEGIKHCLEVENVQEADEGVYTFAIMPKSFKKAGGGEGGPKVSFKGQVVDKAALEKILLSNIGAQDDAALINLGDI